MNLWTLVLNAVKMRYTDLKNPTQSGVLCVPGIYPHQSGWNIPPCEGGLLVE